MWGKWKRTSLLGERAAILELELLPIAHRHLRIAATRNIILHDVVAYGDLPVTAVRHGIVSAKRSDLWVFHPFFKPLF